MVACSLAPLGVLRSPSPHGAQRAPSPRCATDVPAMSPCPVTNHSSLRLGGLFIREHGDGLVPDTGSGHGSAWLVPACPAGGTVPAGTAWPGISILSPRGCRVCAAGPSELGTPGLHRPLLTDGAPPKPHAPLGLNLSRSGPSGSGWQRRTGCSGCPQLRHPSLEPHPERAGPPRLPFVEPTIATTHGPR